jgi:hypothetical protein
MLQEAEHPLEGQILDLQLTDGPPAGRRHERQEQAHRIAVAANRGRLELRRRFCRRRSERPVQLTSIVLSWKKPFQFFKPVFDHHRKGSLSVA